MGLLPPVLLGAFLIVAFALSAQQRLRLGGHEKPMPARQIAYQMRVHHWAAVRLKLADPSLDTYVDALNDNDDLVLSCITGKIVATILQTTNFEIIPELPIGNAEADAVVEELARQSVIEPELGHTGPATVPVPGIGILDFPNMRTATGLVPAPNCIAPNGAPVILTQVVP